MSVLLRSFIAALALCLLAACGGGSTNDALAPAGNGGSATVDATGIWAGSFTVGAGPGSTDVIAVIEKDGVAFFYDQTGVLYVLPTFNGGTTVTGTLTAFAPVGITLSNGQSTETFTFTAMVSAKAITGTFDGNNETGTFTFAPLTAFSANPTIVAGNWQGFYVGSGTAAVALTVQSGGSFVGDDANGCHLSGQTSTIANDDVFDVSLDSTGGPTCAGKLTGLAFESRQDLSGFFNGTTGTYYYVGVSNSTGAFVAELKVQ
ncbi:MAG TPA: hypothetical protein VH327_03945 [Gammaproteobacteria bacterium]|nr:hypothetical protein [Gammaproteobacteria bacterium]